MESRIAQEIAYALEKVDIEEELTRFNGHIEAIEHRDAPAGRDLAEILADPRTLSTDEIIARTEYALAGRFARIATVAELTGS